MDNKIHKCRNKDVCKKACIREHNRSVAMNEVYARLRTMLRLDLKTAKAKTLVEVIQYMKMMVHVLETSDGANGDDNRSNGSANGETAEELEQQYTLNENFRAILPEELQSLELSALATKMPYIMKLLTLNPQKPTAANLDNNANVPTQNENLLERGSESMEVDTTAEPPECLPMTMDDGDVEMAAITSLVDSIQSDPSSEDPSPAVVQGPEPMEVDYAAAEELEQQYTLDEHFPAILPEELRALQFKELPINIPFVKKLLAMHPQKSTAANLDYAANVPENGSTASGTPMETLMTW